MADTEYGGRYQLQSFEQALARLELRLLSKEKK